MFSNSKLILILWLERYQLYKDDNTLIADDHDLTDYGVSENVRSMQRNIFVGLIGCSWITLLITLYSETCSPSDHLSIQTT